MIHSKADIDANEYLSLSELLVSEGQPEDSTLDPDQGTGTTDTQILTDDPIELDQDSLGTAESNDDMRKSLLDVDTLSNVGLSTKDKLLSKQETYIHVKPVATKVPSQVTLQHYLKATREMCEYMNEVGYDYCVNRDCKNDGCYRSHCTKCSGDCSADEAVAMKSEWRKLDNKKDTSEKYSSDRCCCLQIQCDHAVHFNFHKLENGRNSEELPDGCGLRSSFPKSKESTWTQNVNCSLLVSWSLQNVGCLGENDTDYSSKLSDWGAEKIEFGEELKPGDLLIYDEHIDIYAGINSEGQHYKFNGGHYISINATEGNGDSTINIIQTQNEYGWPDGSGGGKAAYYAWRLPWLDNMEGPYEGYEGNESVVSPVTGILLEYGTYDKTTVDSITKEQYRVNVDLKYGPLVKEEDYESKIVSDKVGYAKIMVLNTEYYQNLEQSTNNRWKEQNGGTSLVQQGVYREELVNDKNGSTAEEKLTSKDSSIRWSEIDQTIYGYKEFAENYERAGIAGYIVYIDGFIPEATDASLGNPYDVASKIPFENNPQGRKNATFHFDKSSEGISFKSVTPDNFEDEQLDSMYLDDSEYKLASKNANDKLNAEKEVKINASSSLYLESSKSLNNEELIYIKEGTVIGRTMTDKELLEGTNSANELIREPSTGTYEDNRKFSGNIDRNEKDNIIGNYIRVIMRDLDGTPVENVEDYMKLDDIEEISEDILFMAGVITAEAGGKGDGAIACAWVIKNRVESGKFQDTLARVLVAPGQFVVVNKDPSKCSGWIYQGELISIVVDGVKYYVSKPTDEAIEIAKKVYLEGAYPEMNAKLDGRLYWKSKDTGANRPGALQIPPGTGNWFHY